MIAILLLSFGLLPTDSTQLTFEELMQQQEIRIQFSVGDLNYTTAAHYVLRLWKKEDIFKGKVYFTHHMDDPALFEREVTFSAKELEKLVEILIQIKQEESSVGWVCWQLGFSYFSLTYEDKIFKLESILTDKSNILHTFLLGKIYNEYLAFTIKQLRTYW